MSYKLFPTVLRGEKGAGKMKWITFRDFLKRCRWGFTTLMIALVIFGAIFGIVAITRSNDNQTIESENEQALVEWARANEPVNLKNATIRSLLAGKTLGLTHFDSADHQALGRFVDLVLLVTNGKTTEVRVQAYKDFLKANQLPDSTLYGVYRALTVETLTPLERYGLLQGQLAQTTRTSDFSDFMIVDGLIRAWLKGEKLELEKLSEKPITKPLEVIWWKAWIIFASVLYLLASGVMAFDYFVRADERDG